MRPGLTTEIQWSETKEFTFRSHSSLDALGPLSECTELCELTLNGCPVAQMANYRHHVIANVANIKYFDYKPVLVSFPPPFLPSRSLATFNPISTTSTHPTSWHAFNGHRPVNLVTSTMQTSAEGGTHRGWGTGDRSEPRRQ